MYTMRIISVQRDNSRVYKKNNHVHVESVRIHKKSVCAYDSVFV